MMRLCNDDSKVPRGTCAGLLFIGLFLLPLCVFSDTSKFFDIRPDGRVTLGDHEFADLNAYFSSQQFQDEGRRCGLYDVALARQSKRAQHIPIAISPSDCTTTLTQIKNEYWLGVLTYYVPVWFHIIHRSNGTGDLTDQQIYDQLAVLNEDFGAIAGTLGEQGFNVRVQFELAGIDRIQNNRWYTDSVADETAYKTSLQKDPDRYLNIYTNDAGGYLGYAYFPQDAAGSVYDGVVMLHSAIGGRDNGYGAYNEGRTLVHEVGHYFGLEHTFSGNGSGSCGNTYSDGDLIVDTNAQSGDLYGCPLTPPSSCGSPDPIDNYMGYNDDDCMIRFTAEQANRSVCGLINYRADLFRVELDRSLIGVPTWFWQTVKDQD